MLTIDIGAQESYQELDDGEVIFTQTKPITVRLEHSLISISRWESIWEKPFLPPPSGSQEDKTTEELRSYLSCMIIGEVPEHVLDILWFKYSEDIDEYIKAPSTATVVQHRYNNKPPSRQFVTSELIYYWMIRFNVPFEAQRWHLNRLLTLIDVCNAKENPQKMSPKDIRAHNRELNNQRRAALGTKG